jgi:protein O-GlcNAc transferase
MWMGVPVVTLAGQTHVSRVGASLLGAVGLGELIASTPQEYVDIAVGLARDGARRKALRGSMRDRMATSAIMDAARFARNLEGAYREIWRALVASDPGRR